LFVLETPAPIKWKRGGVFVSDQRWTEFVQIRELHTEPLHQAMEVLERSSTTDESTAGQAIGAAHALLRESALLCDLIYQYTLRIARGDYEAMDLSRGCAGEVLIG
jgi:hypothetical protein